MYGVDIT